jgi:hypothetical protein
MTENHDEMDAWYLLRDGDTDKGLTLLKKAYVQSATPSHIMELGVAYIWLNDYAAAVEHFGSMIRQFPHLMSSFYGMAGVAHWCIEEPAAAVEYWHEGLNAQYADAAGLGAHLPLLLFLASILEPETFSLSQAEKNLIGRAEDKRARIWPGTLIRFVLGMGSSIDTLALASVTSESESKHRKWLVDFYTQILEFRDKRSASERLVKFMRIATNVLQPSFSDRRYFLLLIWSEEFFIARHLVESCKI